jgi:glycosyltransferase involved in cell wall biosynthesis
MRSEGVDVISLRSASVPPRYLARAFAVDSVIARMRPAPAIVQACEFEAEAFVHSLHRRSGTKLVTHLATPTSIIEELNGRGTTLRSRFRGWLMDRMERTQTVRSDAIVSETDSLADLVATRWAIPRARIVTLNQGVDYAGRFSGSTASLPAELHGVDYFVYFGRLEVRKGVHVLAQALPRVLADNPQVHAVLIGNDWGYMGKPMQEFIVDCNPHTRDRLHFFSRQSQSDLYPFLKHALFAVMPSLWENLANASLEALDMGLPVIATQGCGFGEVIVDGVTGLLVPPGAVEPLEAAMQTLVADRERTSVMSIAARRRAEQFGLVKKTNELLQFFEQLAATPMQSLPAAYASTGLLSRYRR